MQTWNISHWSWSHYALFKAIKTSDKFVIKSKSGNAIFGAANCSSLRQLRLESQYTCHYIFKIQTVIWFTNFKIYTPDLIISLRQCLCYVPNITDLHNDQHTSPLTHVSFSPKIHCTLNYPSTMCWANEHGTTS